MIDGEQVTTAANRRDPIVLWNIMLSRSCPKKARVWADSTTNHMWAAELIAAKKAVDRKPRRENTMSLRVTERELFVDCNFCSNCGQGGETRTVGP
jgi:hypothetical protein